MTFKHFYRNDKEPITMDEVQKVGAEAVQLAEDMVTAAASAEDNIDILELLVPNPVSKPGIVSFLRRLVGFGEQSRAETLSSFLKDMSGVNTRAVAAIYKPRKDELFPRG